MAGRKNTISASCWRWGGLGTSIHWCKLEHDAAITCNLHMGTYCPVPTSCCTAADVDCLVCPNASMCGCPMPTRCHYVDGDCQVCPAWCATDCKEEPCHIPECHGQKSHSSFGDTWTRPYHSCSSSFGCRNGKLLHWPKRTPMPAQTIVAPSAGVTHLAPSMQPMSCKRNHPCKCR